MTAKGSALTNSSELKGKTPSSSILPQLTQTSTAQPKIGANFIVVSEREAETLRRRGYLATSTPRPASLEGAHVIIIPTGPNNRQMSETASQLLGIASKIEVLFLPGLLQGEDLSIWFGAQSAQDAELLFDGSERVEITSIEGIRAYINVTACYGNEKTSVAFLHPLISTVTDVTDVAATGGIQETTRKVTVNWPELFSKDTPRREFLIGPWLAAGSDTKIYSPPKAGKSLFSLGVAVVLATGKAGLGMDAREPISVLYLDYENTADDLLDRLESMEISEADDLSNLHYSDLIPIPPLDSKEGGVWIREAVAEFEPQLVIIDTMARAIGGEENSADTYRRYYQHVGLFLKSQKITVLELDHAGKDAAKGPRGSSDKAGYVDAVYKLTANGNRVTLKLEDQRINWLAQEVRFTKLDEPLRHVPDLQPFTPQGIDFAKTLDELEVSVDATRREVMDALKLAGLASKRGVVISEAQKIRRERANRTGRDTFKKLGQGTGQAIGTKVGTGADRLSKISDKRIATCDNVRDQSRDRGGQHNGTNPQPYKGAVSSAPYSRSNQNPKKTELIALAIYSDEEPPLDDAPPLTDADYCPDADDLLEEYSSESREPAETRTGELPKHPYLSGRIVRNPDLLT